MRQAQRAAALGTVAAPKTYTTAERRQNAIAAFRALGDKRLPSLKGVESVDLKMLDAQTTNRTILSVVVTSFNAGGDTTGNTVGDVRHKLGMDQDDVDTAFCWCVNGEDMSGNEAADRLEHLGSGG